MDELWQRYRSFWTPVLIGLGVFLLGLIVVHIVSDDPEAANGKLVSTSRSLGKMTEPSNAQTKNWPLNAEAYRERVAEFAARLDQAGGQDAYEYAVQVSLQAAILRGAEADALRAAVANPDAPSSGDVLAPFEYDPVQAGRALARYEAIRLDRLTLLRTGDPNVGFSRLLNDVTTELGMRANRADIEIRPDALGYEGVTSVTRASLPQRLLNLALVSQIVDLGIRSGIRSVEEVRFDQRVTLDGGEVFLRQYPVTFTVRGDMTSLRPILALLTDPAKTVALTHLALSQPPRGTPLEGIVQLNATATSVVVRPEASLELDKEDQRQ